MLWVIKNINLSIQRSPYCYKYATKIEINDINREFDHSNSAFCTVLSKRQTFWSQTHRLWSPTIHYYIFVRLDPVM